MFNNPLGHSIRCVSLDLLGWEGNHGVPGKQDRNLSIPIHIVFAAVRCLRGLGLYTFVCDKERDGSK